MERDQTNQAVRARICDAFLVALAVMAVPVLASSLYRAVDFGWQPIMGLHIALAMATWTIALWRSRLSYNLRAGFLCFVLLSVGVGGIWVFGLLAGGIAWLVIAPLVGTILFNLRFGLCSLALVLLLAGGVAVATVLGHRLPPFDPSAYMTAPAGWATLILTLALTSGAAAVAIGVLNGSFREALETSQRQAKALEESEATYRRLIENLPEIVYSYSDALGRFYASPPVEDILGYSPDHLAAHPALWHEIIHPEDAAALNRALADAREGKQFDLYYRIRDARGNWRWFHDRSTAIRREDGTIFIDGLASDITEQRHREEQLRQAQKMEAVGQLTGGVAHDFNNLLTVVLGNLELLSDRVADDPAARAHVAKAISGAQRGAELTHRLLAFSRKQALLPVSVNPNALVEGLLDLMRRTLGETIEIEVVGEEDIWHCVADRAQLESAILNLAINARDAMPDGGKLSIGIGKAYLDDEYSAAQADVTPGRYVMIAVSDSGTGIPADAIDHVFEPFFTTKEVGAGSGLGLSMVYGFAKQSGGHVTLYSEEGIGTTVRLYLPRAQAATAPAEPVDEDDAPRSRGETILVVEDDPDVRTLAVALLSELGYAVLEARHGPAALALLDHMPRVDMLLTDVVLPEGMGGPELAEEVRRRYPGVRVIFMSGYTDEMMLDRGRLDEGVDLLNKPFRRGDIARKVRSALDRAPA